MAEPSVYFQLKSVVQPPDAQKGMNPINVNIYILINAQDSMHLLNPVYHRLDDSSIKKNISIYGDFN